MAFDGDGTLWAGDVGEDFFHALLREDRVLEVARPALAHEAALAGLDSSGCAVDVARRIHEAYLAGDFLEERMCEIVTWASAGHTLAEIDAFAETVIASIGLPERLHGEAISVLEWARGKGIPTFLVSASPRPIVEQAARKVGIDIACVASAHEISSPSGVIAASVLRPIPYGAGKVIRLREKLSARPLYAAFGDNAFDVALLLDSQVPVAVRPKPRLVERAAEVPNLVVLERLQTS